MADAWGGSFGTAWGASWTRGDTPPPTVTGGHYGGVVYEKVKRKRRVGEGLEEELAELLTEAKAAIRNDDKKEVVKEIREATLRAAEAKAERDSEQYRNFVDQLNAARVARLNLSNYIASVERIIAQYKAWQDAENDDLEAIEIITRLI